MKNYDMKAYQKKLKHDMDDGRYQHTLGVMYTCAALAMRYEYDIQKAQLAGLLHSDYRGGTAQSVSPSRQAGSLSCHA